MQIVIDIPEDYYKAIKEIPVEQSTADMMIIRNGTPQPKTGWIPVSESLPENHKDVLICLSSDEICIGCYNSHKLPFSNNAIGWGASYVHNWGSNDVIAWMPLPSPYKAESEEDNMSKMRMYFYILGTKPYYKEVSSVKEAKTMIDAIADFVNSKVEEGIFPDHCSTAGLEEYDEEEKKWVTWYDENGLGFDEYFSAESGGDKE